MRLACLLLAACGDNIVPPIDAAVPRTFGKPAALAGVDTTSNESGPSLGSSGLELYFTSPRGGTYALWVASRTSTSMPFGNAVPVAGIDGTGIEFDPEITQDGLELLYTSDEAPYGLRSVTRTAIGAAWSAPTVIDIGAREAPSLALGELRMFVSVAAIGGIEEYSRPSRGAPWSLVQTHVELPNLVYPGISEDGLELYATKQGPNQLYRATRPNADAIFDTPQRVLFDAPVDGAAISDPEVASDGATLYFASNPAADYDLFAATR